MPHPSLRERMVHTTEMQRDIVVIGGSAGALEPLRALVAAMPADLPASIFVVLHLAPSTPTVLPQMLSRGSRIAAREAVDGEPIEQGRIYVAAADRHLLVRDGHVLVTRGPTENRARPAIDPLFRSAARAFGSRVVGVVLSGYLDDGAAGLYAVKAAGGATVVQAPDDALVPNMPLAALEAVHADHVIRADEIGALLVRLVIEGAPANAESRDVPSGVALEDDIAAGETTPATRARRSMYPSGFGCPDCGGVLFERGDGTLGRFRCRVGHAYSAANLAERQSEKLDETLWVAYRAIEERAALAQRLADRARAEGRTDGARRQDDELRKIEARAELLRKVLGVSK
jgi:two-component system chemotaxis response regulator CheB